MKKITIILLFITFSVLTAFTQNQPEKFSRVKIDLKNRNIIELAGLGISLQPFDFKPGEYFIGELSESEIKQAIEDGFNIEILIQDMADFYQQRNVGLDKNVILKNQREALKSSNYPVPENFSLGSMGGFHTYDELLSDLDLMFELFPNLITEKAPISETNSIEGRPIYWVRISNSPEETTEKPKVLYTALTHAREPAGMQQMLYHMWYLLENYETDAESKYLIDNLEMYFVPCVNPDGYIYCETLAPNGGAMHRKNKRINSDSSIGVDLNRNFGYMWGYDNYGSSPTPSSLTYRGTSPFSEPETQNVKEFAESYNFSLALNNHTYSDLLIYPWGYENLLTPDSTIFIKYAQFLTQENNYLYGTCYETLYYFANGGSDDWFYGEQETKEKVFAFTPEAGAPSDGFWPAINKITDICAGHMHMNNALAHLALAYGELSDISGSFVEDINTDIEFELINIGQDNPATFTVSIQPLTNNIITIGNPVEFNNVNLLDTLNGNISLQVKSDIEISEKIEYIITLSNGMFEWNDTITRYYGVAETVFFDPCDNIDNWVSAKWGVTNAVYFSPPGSINDSPAGNYSNNQFASITLKNPIDLTGYSSTVLSFKTRFRVEKGYDFVQLFISNDAQTWVPLEGKHTEFGTQYQAQNEPLYHGYQREWLNEEIDITPYSDNNIWLSFILQSDGSVNYEGFYFDDLTISALKKADDGNNVQNNSYSSVNISYNNVLENIQISLPDNDLNSKIDVRISNISGRSILQKSFQGESMIIIPFANQKPGVYVVNISGDYNASRKIVVIK
jgi:carboxypeptidase T